MVVVVVNVVVMVIVWLWWLWLLMWLFWACAVSTTWARINAIQTVEPYAFAVHEQLMLNFSQDGAFSQIFENYLGYATRISKLVKGNFNETRFHRGGVVLTSLKVSCLTWTNET